MAGNVFTTEVGGKEDEAGRDRKSLTKDAVLKTQIQGFPREPEAANVLVNYLYSWLSHSRNLIEGVIFLRGFGDEECGDVVSRSLFALRRELN